MNILLDYSSVSRGTRLADLESTFGLLCSAVVSRDPRRAVRSIAIQGVTSNTPVSRLINFV